MVLWALTLIMNISTANSNSVIRTFRYIEWTLLLSHFAIYLLNFNRTNYSAQPFNFFVISTCLSICALLSFVLPVSRPTWQRIVYIYLELILIIAINLMGFGWDVLIYLILAKSCFMLRRKDVIIITISTGFLWNIAIGLNLPQRLEFERLHIPERIARLYDTNNIIVLNLINNTAGYIATSIFVILFAFVIIAEQKSRQKAETLAKEVEILAANLERTRIARDIHDSLGHTLTTLDVQLELAQKMRQRNSEQALQALDTAKLLASQCLQDVRRSVQTMRQSDFNLNEALNTLVEQVKQNQKLIIHVDLNLPQLPLQTSHQLYCIVQEGFTNIQKHAQASYVKLSGFYNNETTIIEIIDNGRGFNIELPYSGFGLRGMQERVQMLGGKLNIETNLGQGTKIQLIIPK
ncbi:integral membrane sensor signal transduction histidine kinase [Calothrix sp. NIES-4071]|nr:integral membrane sensor signal transduction histidine kinase [Calothrix sp. NIES-4071]BAZ56478.1 integral membrane sensor signal transduction histidine kinase [Calothrix sp. NIES-4105]